MTSKEREILNSGGLNPYPHTDISYIYVIKINDTIRYIGLSSNPKKRWASHKVGMLRNSSGYSISLYGIFEKWEAKKVEKELIIQHSKNQLYNKRYLECG